MRGCDAFCGSRHQQKAQRQVNGLGDADSFGDLDFPRAGGVEDVEGAAGEVLVVVRPGDSQGLGEFGGAGCEVGAVAPFAHEVLAGEGLEGADEDAAGGAVGFSDDVEALVHAVDEIDVSVAGRAEDGLRSCGEAGGGMSREIVLAEVSFHFDDAAGGFAMNEGLAEERAGDFDGGAIVERAREDHRIH